jgi:antitoxin HicB
MRYPVTVHPEPEGGCWLSFPDVPEAKTNGDNEADALSHALDCLETAFDIYFDANELVPLPSEPKRRQHTIEVPASVAAKILLHNELIAQRVRPSELARRMKIPRQEMTRLLDPRHTTKIDSIALALSALGKHLELSLATGNRK